MRKSTLSIPEIFLIGGTRGALGAGIALLLGDKLDRKKRRAVGWTLFLVGIATTIPLALVVFGNKPGRRLSGNE
jgi:4-amino-4-deoxy-L-arabinose transferase-like glycosyltransferase